MSKKQIQKETRIELPPHVYRYSDIDEQMMSEQNESNKSMKLLKLEWNQGVFLYHEGAEYPMKQLVDPKTMWLTNASKRTFIASLKLFTYPIFIPIYVIFLFSPFSIKRKVISRFLEAYCDITYKNISPVILKQDFMTPMAIEIEWLIFAFLKNIGISNDISDKFAQIFATLINYDSAYRFRIQDLFSETNSDKLITNTRKEIKRLFKILESRDDHIVAKKFKVVYIAIQFMLLNKRIKKALQLAISEVSIRNLSYDEADKYWVSMRYDYKYMGLTYEERQENIKHLKQPTFYEIL